MKTLVIHPKDSTTDFLCEIYKHENWVTINTNVSKKTLKDQINAHDRIIMLGHGTEKGLIGFDRFVIDSTLVYLLREKICVCIWCNANDFVEKYGLKGFYTGMIISEHEEAVMYNISTNLFWITESNKDFALAIKKSINHKNMLEKAISFYEGNSNIVEFNKKNLFQNHANS